MTLTANNMTTVSDFVTSYCDRNFGQDGLDIAQDVLTVIWKRRQDDMVTNEANGNLKRWLVKLCHQQRADHIKALQSQKRDIRQSLSISVAGDDQNGDMQITDYRGVNDDKLAEVMVEVAKLPKDDRDAIHARLNGTTKRLADIKGLPETTIAMRATRAIRKLKSTMNE